MASMDVCEAAAIVDTELAVEPVEQPPGESVAMDTEPTTQSTEQSADPADDSEDEGPVLKKRNHRKRSRLDDNDAVDEQSNAQDQPEDEKVAEESSDNEDANGADEPKRRRLKKSKETEEQEEQGDSDGEEGDDEDPGGAGDDDYADSDEEKMYERMIAAEDKQLAVAADDDSDADEMVQEQFASQPKEKTMTQKQMQKLTSENQRLIRETKTRFPQSQGIRKSATSLVEKLRQRKLAQAKPVRVCSQPSQPELSDSDSDSDLELELPAAIPNVPCTQPDLSTDESSDGKQECSEHFHDLVLDSETLADDSQTESVPASTDICEPAEQPSAKPADLASKDSPAVDSVRDDSEMSPAETEPAVHKVAAASDAVLNAVCFETGHEVMYTNRDGEQSRAVIEGIDHGVMPPCYTVKFADGNTRGTEASRIEPVAQTAAGTKPAVTYVRKKKQQALAVAKVAMDLDEPETAAEPVVEEQSIADAETSEFVVDHQAADEAAAEDKCQSAVESSIDAADAVASEETETKSADGDEQLESAPSCPEEEMAEAGQPESDGEQTADVAVEATATEAAADVADDSDDYVMGGDDPNEQDDLDHEQEAAADNSKAFEQPEDAMQLLLQKQQQQQAKEQMAGENNQFIDEQASEEEDIMDYGSDDEGNEDKLKDKFAADLEDLVAKPADMEGVDLERSEELMHLQQAEDEAADEKAQKEVEAIIKGERRHGRRNRRNRAGMQEGLLSDNEDDDESDTDGDLSEMEVDVDDEPEEILLGGGNEEDDEMENDDVEERRRRLRLRRERLRKERLSKVTPMSMDGSAPGGIEGLAGTGSSLMGANGNSLMGANGSSLMGNGSISLMTRRMSKSNVSQHSLDQKPSMKLQRHGSFLAMSSDKREKAAGIYCSSNSIVNRTSSFVFSAEDSRDSGFGGVGTPNQNSNPVPSGSAKTKGWFEQNKSNSQQGSWFRGKNDKSAQSGQKLFRSLSMPTKS